MEQSLSWILDNIEDKSATPETRLSRGWSYDEKLYAQNRDFVHSLGLKCDYVGWSNLDLNRMDADEILEKIRNFCDKEGWIARGLYFCSSDNVSDEWFHLALGKPKSEYNFDKFGDGIHIGALTAYKERSDLMAWCWEFFGSEKFVEVYNKYNMQGLDFCWARDSGRYNARQQYFQLYGKSFLPKKAVADDLDYETNYFFKKFTPHGHDSEIYKKYLLFGGILPRLSEVFDTLSVHLPFYYPKNDFPKSGFVFVYSWPWEILVHKDTAKILIEEKIITEKNLVPISLYTELPSGYHELASKVPAPVPLEIIEKQTCEYNKIKEKKRPEHKCTEKQALSALRKAKKENGEYLDKKIPKEKAEEISKTEWAFLVPYYLVTAGGSFSDGEYHLLQFDEATDFNREYAEDLENDDTARDILPEGTVFGICADGDKIIKLDDGKVIRVSHEEPEILEEWPSVAQFIFDCAESED